MGILDFKNPFSKKPQVLQDYLSLSIAPNKIIATIWNFQGENINVLSTAEREFENSDALIHEAAIVIDNAAEQAKTDVSKVVFGLSHYWFEGEKIKPEMARTLKDLSNDLELDAQAFVTIALAINHLLKVEQAITPQAILVGHFGNFCEVHLIKNNKVVETKTVSGEITSHKVINLIEEIKSKHENLPSKIIIYGKERDSLTSKLSQANWQEIFVHEPKVESLDDKTIGQAVAFAQASDVLGHDPDLNKKQPEEHEPKPMPLSPEPLTAAGFVEGEDILLRESNNQEVEPKETELQEEAAVITPQHPEDYAVDLGDANENLRQSIPESHQPKQQRRKLPKISFSKLIPKNLSPKKLGIIAASVVLFFMLSIFIAGQTLTSANVLIKVNTKTETFDFTTKVINNGANNFGNGEIGGKVVTGSADGSQKAVATGSKKSGTASKGAVIIQNWDKESSKTFSAGTEIITKDGLKFKLDSEVNVASRSSTTSKAGEAKTGATAIDIGPKYNIGAGTALTIVGFDEVFYSGVTDSDFTGGDEKQITVASQDDLAKIEKALTDSLTEKAKNDLQGKIGGAKVYDESKVVKVTKKQFDRKVDEEASLINLDMSLDYEGIAFDENDLKNYLAEIANKKLDSNKESLPETIEIKDVKVTRTKDILTITGKYDVGVINKIDTEDIKSKIAGKGVKEARSIIKSNSDVADIQITFSPAIPFIDTVPSNKSKINIKVQKN